MADIPAESLDEEKLRSLKYPKPRTNTDDLMKLCEEYQLDYENYLPESTLTVKDKLTQLLHIYRVVVSSLPKPVDIKETNNLIFKYATQLNINSKSLTQAVQSIYERITQDEIQKASRHPSYSLEYNLIPGFMYIAARNSGHPIFIIEILEKAADNSLPYFTGYNQYLKQNKELSRGYNLVPTNIPSVRWIRKIINRMIKNNDCEVREYPAKKCFKKIEREVSIPSAIITVAEYLHSKIKKRSETISEEAMVIGGIIVAIKLIYGLDDRPYVRGVDEILKEVFSEKVFISLMKTKNEYIEHDKSYVGRITSTIPTLYQFMRTLRKAVIRRRQSIPWSIGKLRELPVELMNDYLNLCETVFTKTLHTTSKESQVLENLSNLFSSLNSSHDQANETPYEIDVNAMIEEKGKINKYLLEECKFAQKIKNSKKKVIFPHATESYRHYKYVFSDLCKDPLSFECQYLFVTFGKYLSEPINQLIRAVNMYESIMLK